MNSKLSFFLAPVTSLFSPGVYRDAAKSPSGGRGVLYLLYWAFFTAVFATAFIAVRVIPVADTFMQWAQKEMPAIIWTPDGLSLENGQDKAELTHPTYGPIAIFDMTKTVVNEADMGKARVFVTATRIYVKKLEGPAEVHDITKAGIKTQQRLPPRVKINGDFVRILYKNLKNTLMVLIPAVVFVSSFFIFLFGNLIYSLIGLLLNWMRKDRLGYGAIFNLTCFATGTSLTLTWIKVVSPLRAMPWPLLVTVLINLIYMFFAFKVTDRKEEKAA